MTRWYTWCIIHRSLLKKLNQTRDILRNFRSKHEHDRTGFVSIKCYISHKCYKRINFYFLGPMEIQFTSDTSTFDRGFKLRYDVIGKKSDVDCGETNLPLWPWFTLNPNRWSWWYHDVGDLDLVTQFHLGDIFGLLVPTSVTNIDVTPIFNQKIVGGK